MSPVCDEKIEKLLELARLIANPDNWCYLDDSGCPKGIGRSFESWCGEGQHPHELAKTILSE